MSDGARPTQGTGWNWSDEDKGRHVKGKVKTPFCITSATAKAFRKLPSAHRASLRGGQEQDFSFFRSRSPAQTKGKLGLSNVLLSVLAGCAAKALAQRL